MEPSTDSTDSGTTDESNTWPSAEPQHAAVEEAPQQATPEQPAQVDAEAPVAVGQRVTTPRGDNDGVEGVQTGGLTYVQNEDGTRTYPEQDKNIDVTVEPASA